MLTLMQAGVYGVDTKTGAVRMMYAFPRTAPPPYRGPIVQGPPQAYGRVWPAVPTISRGAARPWMGPHISSGVIPGIKQATTTGQLVTVLALLGLVGGGAVTIIAKILGATWAHAATWGVGGSALAMVLGYPGRASAAPVVTTACPDGSLPPGGNVSSCPPPKMGPNDPDSPPGGWSYNGQVSSAAAIQAAATALAAVDPCQPANVQLVRNFQGAVGLVQTNSGQPDWSSVNPPGTDGRYGGDAAKALAQYVPNAPPACYSNSNPTRPSWWGAVGAFTNPAAGN